MNTNVLSEIGLTKIEIDVYLVLVKFGELGASDIATKINISRTYVYDALEHLLQKGLISYIIKNNRKKFNALDFNKLYDYLDEKKRIIDTQKNEMNLLISELSKIKTISDNLPKIEILQGSEGLKTILNDIVRTGKDLVGWGATSKIEDHLPEYVLKKYLKERDKRKIELRQITSRGDAVLKSKYTEFRHISKEYSSPITFSKYGDKIIIFFWLAIPMVVRIKDEGLAKSFQDHFEFLWRSAKLKPFD
jgi:sugar-specific transcriptional regulator TrmB